jgi:hypothetical protein
MTRNGMDALEKHFKQWNKISERLHTQLEPVLEAQRSIERSLRPTLEIQQALRSSSEPFLEEQRKLQKALDGIKLPSFQLPDLSAYTNQIEQYQKSLIGIISPAFEEIRRSFRELPPKMQGALMLLAQHGWFWDLNIALPSLWKISKAIVSGEINKAEKTLVEYFEGQVEEIEKTISTRFPRRAHIISAAINAHRRGEYYLSIPVFLAQTDGICKDVVGQYFFMKKDKKPRTAIYVEQVAADTLRAALLSPLAASTPIAASEYERDECFNLLNRHMVLHGDSLDYGTKVNSLKTISLINYVSQALEPDVDYP